MKLSAEQEYYLGKKAMMGSKEARDMLIESNMALVRYIVSGMNLPSWYDKEDLFQAGYEGLIEASRSYDPEKGRFGTYASSFVKGSINKEYRRAGMEASYSTKCKAMKVLRMIEEQKILSGILDDIEVAEMLGISKKTLNNYKVLSDKQISLDKALYDDHTLLDMIGYDETDDYCQDDLIQETIQVMLQSLTSLQRQIVKFYFGFYDGNPHSYKDTAKVCGVKECYVKKQIPIICERMRVYAEQSGLRQVFIF